MKQDEALEFTLAFTDPVGNQLVIADVVGQGADHFIQSRVVDRAIQQFATRIEIVGAEQADARGFHGSGDRHLRPVSESGENGTDR